MVAIPAHYQRSFDTIRLNPRIADIQSDLKLYSNSAEYQLQRLRTRPEIEAMVISDNLLLQGLNSINIWLDGIIKSQNETIDTNNAYALDQLSLNLYLAKQFTHVQTAIVSAELYDLGFEAELEQSHILPSDSKVAQSYKKDYIGLKALEEIIEDLNAHLDKEGRVDESEDSLFMVDLFIERLKRYSNERKSLADLITIHKELIPSSGEGDTDTSSPIYAELEKQIIEEIMSRLAILVKTRDLSLFVSLDSWLDNYPFEYNEIPIIIKHFANISGKLHGCDTKEKAGLLDRIDCLNQPGHCDFSVKKLSEAMDYICPSDTKGFISEDFLNRKAIEAIKNCPQEDFANLVYSLALIEREIQREDDENDQTNFISEDFTEYFTDTAANQLYFSFAKICTDYQLDL